MDMRAVLCGHEGCVVWTVLCGHEGCVVWT